MSEEKYFINENFKLTVKIKAREFSAIAKKTNGNEFHFVIAAELNEGYIYKVMVPKLLGELYVDCEISECIKIKENIFYIKSTFVNLRKQEQTKLNIISHKLSMQKLQLSLIHSVPLVLSQIMQCEAKIKHYEIKTIDSVVLDFAVVVKVFGDLAGNSLINFNKNIAKSISVKMWSAFDPEAANNINDEMITETLKELANMIVGNTTTFLYSKFKLKTDIAPPSILTNKSLMASDTMELISIRMEIELENSTDNLNIVFMTKK